jgi:hypothetical protein
MYIAHDLYAPEAVKYDILAVDGDDFIGALQRFAADKSLPTTGYST